MQDVRIDPGPGAPQGVTIPCSELVERYSRASGPGGQGVNTSDSRVQLSFDVAESSALSQWQRQRALTRLHRRLDGTILRGTAAEHRSQRLNRGAARTKLARLLAEAMTPPAEPRRATGPSRRSVQRRLDSKRRRGRLKRDRRRPSAD
ncbi:MAG: alternative ribosome rescue aminoacyl-tRNA hydrolase ArfB [Arachnia sp.]